MNEFDRMANWRLEAGEGRTRSRYGDPGYSEDKRAQAIRDEDVRARASGRVATKIRPEMARRVDHFEEAATWLSKIEPALTSQYLVKTWLDRGTMSTLYGEPNVGKTFLALDLSLHVAARVPWHGYRVAGEVDREAATSDPDGYEFKPWPGAVVYVSAEGGNGIDNRIAAFKRANPVLASHISDGDFVLMKCAPDLHDDADAEAFESALNRICENAVSLIVIDTLARTMGVGDENSSQDMGKYIRILDGIRECQGCHVMIVHHSGKDASRGARGSSSLRGAVDTEICLTLDGKVITAENMKQRDGPKGGLFSYTLETVFLGHDEDGDAVTSAVVRPCEVIKRAPRVTGQAKVALQAFSDALAHHGETKSGDMFPTNRQCVSLAHWRAYCDRHALTDGDSESASRQAFVRARRTLAEKGVIKIVDEFAWRVSDEA